MKKKIKSLKLYLKENIPVEDVEPCLKVIDSDLNDLFDDDGNQIFLPESLVAIREAFSEAILKIANKQPKKKDE